MEKIRIGLIGGGWRSEFYVRAAQQLSERFEIVCAFLRSPEKAAEFTKTFGIRTVCSLDELMAAPVDYVILTVKRDAMLPMLERLFQAEIPVLCETPPAPTLAGLNELWGLAEKYRPRINVAEQYFLQPYHQSVLKLVESGLIGEVGSVNISMMHGYHAANMIRRYLGIGFENGTVSGKRYRVPSVVHCGRGGLDFSGTNSVQQRSLVTLDFENGKTALYDFNEDQYFSYIRTRHLCVSGVRGEIYDLDVRYLNEKFEPVTDTLKRIDLGAYSNLEGFSHRGFQLGGKRLYQNPFEGARMSDDEIAVASCMVKMYESLHGEKDFYPLQQALQDSYLALAMEQAAETGLPVATENQSWVDR